MYVYIYIYVCVCIYIYVYICIYMYMSVHISAYIYMYLCICHGKKTPPPGNFLFTMFPDQETLCLFVCLFIGKKTKNYTPPPVLGGK